MRLTRWLTALAILPGLLLLGCEPKVPAVGGMSPSTTGSKPAMIKDSHDDHDHGKHDHSHDVGPNGGHIGHFEPSDAHFEWTHNDDDHSLSFHFEELVSAGKKIGSVSVDVSFGGETKSFKIEADPKAKISGSVYTIKNQELMTSIEASGSDKKGIQSNLVIDLDGVKQTAPLEHDEHDHSGHKH